MSLDPVPYEPAATPTAPFRFRPTALVAWLIIIGVCVLLPLLRAEQKAALTTTQPSAAGPEATAEPARVDFQSELAGRVWVGSIHAAGGDKAKLEGAIGMPQNTPVERIAMAIVLADIGERERALAMLTPSTDPAAAELLAFYGSKGLTRASTQPTTMPTSATQATTLVISPTTAAATMPAKQLTPDFNARFGWFARLAATYGQPDTDPARAAVLADAKRTVFVTFGALGIAGLAGLLGLGLFITAIVLVALGRIRPTVARPVGPAHVYVEAVAVYLGGFVLVSLGIAKFLPDATLSVEILGLGAVVLLAAAWPLLRGVAARELRLDWGLHSGRGVGREILAGIGGYLAGVPVLFVGLVIMFILLAVTKTTASHPIVQQANNHSWIAVLSLYGLASVFAPLTEELMFRGALVSHLRAGVGVVLAALISGLIFGAVHPQGWAVVPALMSVGAVLALIRQWRGSLIASITAHALHNAFLVTIMTLATR